MRRFPWTAAHLYVRRVPKAELPIVDFELSILEMMTSSKFINSAKTATLSIGNEGSGIYWILKASKAQ